MLWKSSGWGNPRHDLNGEERKKLHNLVLELKGNIRVFVRVSWPRFTCLDPLEVEISGFLRCFFGEEIHPLFLFLRNIKKKIYEHVS